MSAPTAERTERRKRQRRVDAEPLFTNCANCEARLVTNTQRREGLCDPHRANAKRMTRGPKR